MTAGVPQQSETDYRPATPTSIAETGLNIGNLLKLLLKTIYVRGADTPTALAQELKLHIAVCKELLQEAEDQQLIETIGSAGVSLYADYRYGLTGKGRELAIDAVHQCQYVGPAPVTLADYLRQIERQKLANEPVSRDLLNASLADLVVPDVLERRLGPAVNAGRSLLLYGPAGNGKSSIAEALARIFGQTIYIPYCLDVDGAIIRIFDPTLHQSVAPTSELSLLPGAEEDADAVYSDRRWVACRRPVIMAGGELTLAMLDLSYSAETKFYEAPLHVKAIGGTFVIDDLGRHLVRPEDLLNRWIVPMEKRVDYLTLRSGKTFALPFDTLLIFSTNLSPDELMDPAFLRRIPYKVEIAYPTGDEFRTVFRAVCRKHDLAYREEVVEFVIRALPQTYAQPLSFYQPKFIVEHVLAACRYLGRAPELTQDLAAEALRNIATRQAAAPSPPVRKPNGTHLASPGIQP